MSSAPRNAGGATRQNRPPPRPGGLTSRVAKTAAPTSLVDRPLRVEKNNTAPTSADRHGVESRQAQHRLDRASGVGRRSLRVSRTAPTTAAGRGGSPVRCRAGGAAKSLFGIITAMSVAAQSARKPFAARKPRSIGACTATRDSSGGDIRAEVLHAELSIAPGSARFVRGRRKSLAPFGPLRLGQSAAAS